MQCWERALLVRRPQPDHANMLKERREREISKMQK